MSNVLSQQFNTKSLFKYALPSMLMMMFLSLYVIVDGMFISSVVSTTALAAVNIVFPVISLLLGVSIMLSTGGSAIISKKMGEGKVEEARSNFTFIIICEILVGLAFAIIGNIFLEEIILSLGATDEQLGYGSTYLSMILLFAPMYALQSGFQILFVSAGKPKIGLICVVGAGLFNIVFDYIFIVLFNMEMLGAALATVLGYCIPAFTGLIYFSVKRDGLLYFVKPTFDFKMLGKACINGSSEMVTNLAQAVTTFLFNFVFMKYYGDDGVAAITVILYFQFIMASIFFGYSNGVSPVISYKYGEGNFKQIKTIFKSSIKMIAVASILALVISAIIINPVAELFSPDNENVRNLVVEGYSYCAIIFLLFGFSIFSSAFFTSLSDGKTSAIISCLRTFVFLALSISLLHLVFGEIGCWLGLPVAEILGFIVAVSFILGKKNQYNYM